MEKYITLNLWTLRVIGIWHPEKASQLELKMNFILRSLAVGSVLFIVVPAVILVAFHLRRYDLSRIVEILALLLSAIMIFSKILNIAVRKNRVQFLLNKMSKFWQNATINESAEMQSYALLGRNVTRMYSILGFCSIISFMAQPFFDSGVSSNDLDRGIKDNSSSHVFIVNRLPFDGWETFFDNYNNSDIIIFALVYTIHIITGIIATTASVGHDSLFVVLILHVCANLKAVAFNLNAISSSDDDHHDDDNGGNYNVEKKIINCVNKLRDTVQYTKELDEMMSVFLLGQTVSSTLILCLTSFLVSRDMNSNKDFFKYISFWAAALFQLFIFCWAASYLQTETDRVGRSAYDVYGELLINVNLKNSNQPHGRFDRKIPRCLQMIIIRAQKPPKITAGNFYTISLENYKNILSTSYSYFTILRAFAVDSKTPNG